MNTIRINGNNVSLLLLSKNILIKWLRDIHDAEVTIGYVIDSEPVEGHLKHVFELKINNLNDNPNNEIWFSYFAIIYLNTVVGLIGPKGKPINNSIEIGYGLLNKYWNKGIMTESVSILCDWYFENTSVTVISADTDNTNISSQKVLIKNGFKLCKTDNLCGWEKRKF
jgi:[ribosomal protein S5]-alanine N-acetyltransferase